MPSSVAAADEPRRIVPGAPPPAPLSKSQQKKKRKSGKPKEDGPAPDAILDLPKAALIESAPSVADVANGAVEPALVSEPVPALAPAPAPTAESKKTSPSVEAVAKRLRALGKKVQRISTYAHLPADQLNEDQRRTAATLPALELAVKELEEVKKNIETIEADHAKEEANARAQEEEAVKQRIAEAVVDAQAASVSTASRILAFIRFSHLISSEPSITTAGLTDTERNAVYVAAQLLLGESSEQREAVVAGFFSGTGDIEGVEYARLRQILDDHLAVPEEPVEPVEPPRSPTPVAAEPEAAPEEGAHGIPASASGASSFHFMQASELEGTPFEQGAEWIEKPEEEAAAPVAQQEYAHEEPEPAAPAEPAGPIDWANDDGGLPEIESLQAKFASSGEATPNLAPEAAAADGWTPAEPAAAEAYTPPTTNGHAAGPVVDDDGFTEARRTRTTSTRGGGDRGFRGRGFRGGERGGYRGGRPDGEFRGRGGFRGGDRGRGEFRGRGRGGERGFRGGRGAAPVEV